MSDIITLKKGLDIKLAGKAEQNVVQAQPAKSYGLTPGEFEGVTPKLLVQADDAVKAGTPLFFDKAHPDVLFVSPVSGKVKVVDRGEKRKIIHVIVESDGSNTCEQFDIKPLADSNRADVIATLLKGGMWPFIIQRPYGILADPADTPKAVFVSGFDSAPLAPDMNFALKERYDDLQKGFDVLGKISGGKVHLGLRYGTSGVLDKITGVEKHTFKGPHPAGNVGVQIHHVDPVSKGEIVWTVNVQDVAVIGRFFNTGRVDMTRVIAVTGSEVVKPRYVSVIAGASIDTVAGKDAVKPQKEGDSVRIINGNALVGGIVSASGFVGLRTNQITVLPEGDKYEMLGWMMPRFSKFSVSHGYFSWLSPRKEYVLDTNVHGGHRPFIVTGLFEKYVPMDIYPMYLLKAMLAEDIDKMENLGIYEVIEEDFALCEFVDPSKNDIQQIVRNGINLMIKELS